MDFVSVFRFLIEAFERDKIDFALIGGFALQAAGVERATRDIDVMVLAKDTEKIKLIFSNKSYDLFYESEHVLSFASQSLGLGRVDFLLVKKEYGKRMLKQAREREILDGTFKIKSIREEDIIGLKVQSYSNNPTRLEKDMSDIKALFRTHNKKLDIELIREYFRIFEKEKDLEKIIQETKDYE